MDIELDFIMSKLPFSWGGWLYQKKLYLTRKSALNKIGYLV